MEAKLRLGAYTRSSDLGERSLEAWKQGEGRRQGEDIHRAAIRYGGEVVRTWEEPNVSGKGLERKQFLEVLAAIETGELDGGRRIAAPQHRGEHRADNRTLTTGSWPRFGAILRLFPAP
jgi:hypothetical protein